MRKLATVDDVHRLLGAPTASAALSAAIQTGLLWRLADQPMDGDRVVAALEIPGKRGYYWLQYLHWLGILDLLPQGYAPSALARAAILETRSQESWGHLFMDEAEKDACVHGLPQLISAPGSLWTLQGLPDPVNYVDRMRVSLERAREFTRTLFEVHQALAVEVAARLDLTGVVRMMDMGGGSGVVSMALLRQYPALSATVVDIENVCIAGREIGAEEGFSERLTFHPAEFAEDEFPDGFDLVLQCDVTVFGVELLQKVWRSLNPGGRLVFVGHLAPAENSAPPTRIEWIFLDSLHNPHVSVPTVQEFTTHLGEAGFKVSNEVQTFGNGWTIVQARKGEVAI